ncbi:MAG: hypothetical protein IKE76_01095 [Clostridia bacterium]|nr:hypothetical protein [Clostridia bacterium]
MAHYEYTKTFNFYATAEVPYRYTCGKCGREVTGRAELVGKDEAKVSSRHADKLAISDQSRERHQAEAVSRLRGEVLSNRRAVKKGNFTMLDKYKKCPHCGAEQRWGYRKSSAAAFILLAIGAAALAVLCAVVYVRQVRGGNSDFTFLGCALFLLFFGAMFVVRAVWDIKGLKAARGQSEQKPEVFFDQMTSPWLDRLKD